MKKPNLFLATLFAALLVTSSHTIVRAAEDLNIVAFDINKIMTDTKAGKSIGEQVQKMDKDLQEEMSDLRKKYQSEGEKLGEQRNLIAADVLQSRAEELQVNVRRDERKLASEAEAIRAGLAEAQKKLIETALEGVDKISKQKKADIVLRREAFYFATPTIDITKDVVAYVDKELPRIKVTPVKN